MRVEFRLREKSGKVLTDDLQIHLLELPKLQVTAKNVYYARSAERWAFFLGHAEHLTDEDVGRLFPDQEIVEAAGVLKMISQTPERRVFYNARLKFQRDEESRLRRARQEGLEQGREQGVLVGRILILEQLLKLPESSVDKLAACDASQ